MKVGLRSLKLSSTGVVIGFLLLVAMPFMMLLPHIYPESSWLNLLFGHRKFILFWMLLAIGFLLWITRPGRNDSI